MHVIVLSFNLLLLKHWFFIYWLKKLSKVVHLWVGWTVHNYISFSISTIQYNALGEKQAYELT